MIEIRDRGTFIPALAIRLEPTSEEERWLLARAGFGREPEFQKQYVLLIRIGGSDFKCVSDPYQWGTASRTYFVAHEYIRSHWDEVADGGVICVEFILGERPEPKISERKHQPFEYDPIEEGE